MAGDLNSCNFIGRLGGDPEVRYLPNGDAVATFSIAVGERWKDKDSGERKEKTEWVRCVAWRQLGEVCGEYLKKGQQVFVNGKLITRKWQDKDGVDRYTSEIVLSQMQMLGSKREVVDGEERPASAAKTQQQRRTPESGGGGSIADMDDDIPF